MPAGDVTALVAGNAIEINTVNTNFANLQATVQALPVANLKNNRASFTRDVWTQQITVGAPTTYYMLAFQNHVGVDGLRLVKLGAHANLTGAGANIVFTAEKCATIAGVYTTMCTFTLSTADSGGMAGAYYYEIAQPAAGVENLPDSYWFRVRAAATLGGAAINDLSVWADFDHVLKPKA